jgi:hypothetical protein
VNSDFHNNNYYTGCEAEKKQLTAHSKQTKPSTTACNVQAMNIGIFKNHRDITLFMIAVLGLVGVTLGLNYIIGNATLAISAVASFALVLVTAVLALYTYHYTEAATKQVEAMNRQVEALTNPILNVGIQIIERTIQNVAGVAVALEVYIQNAGPGNACEITFDVKEKDDFTFVVGQTFQRFRILDTIRDGVKRLPPGQRRSLATIILSPDNVSRRDMGEMTKNEVMLTYKNATGDSFTDSYLLDFDYNFELIKTLSNIPYSTLYRAPRPDARPKTPAHSMPILDLTKKDLTEPEKEFLRSLYDCVNEDDVTGYIQDKELYTLAEKIGLNEHDAYRCTMVLKAFGLVEVDFVLGGGIAHLKLTSSGVLYARRLGSE